MSPKPAYPAHWEADVVLRDGAPAHLRPITPADAAALQDFHVRQSPASTYMRFFTHKEKLSLKELWKFTRVDYTDRVALVVTVGEDIIGVGRYDRIDGGDEAEVAFNISDRHQGRGLGSILLEHLAAAARENGIGRFMAEVLPQNARMLAVFTKAGYEVSHTREDDVLVCSFDIDPTDKSLEVMFAREHRAEARSVAQILNPRSIAVVGASRDPMSIGARITRNIVEAGFDGPVHAVNPEALELAGTTVHGAVSHIPADIDLAVVAVPAHEVEEVVLDCAAAGVKAALIVSGGFGEQLGAAARERLDGAAAQRRVVALARSRGMRVVGPASLGLVHTSSKLNASLAPALPPAARLGLFAQSSAMGITLYAESQLRGSGFSSMVSAGNRGDLSGNDMMQFWEEDPDTDVVGMYLESFGNPRKFSRIARRLGRTKPVVVATSSIAGIELPVGSGGHLAPRGALQALLRQAGTLTVETIPQLLDVAHLLLSQPLPGGGRTAIVVNSPGVGQAVANFVRKHGLELVGTPLEVDTSEAVGPLRSQVAALASDGGVDLVLGCFLPSLLVSQDEMAQACAAGLAGSGTALAVSYLGALPGAPGAPWRPGPPFAAGLLDEVPIYPDVERAVRALSKAAGYAQWLARDHRTVRPGADPRAAAAALGGLRGPVPEADLARALAAYGVDVVAKSSARTAEEAVEKAEELGWPVALKSQDPALRHRLDLGGVRLGLADARSLEVNFREMREQFSAAALDVQTMVEAGSTCRVEAVEDPALGPVVSVFFGGDDEPLHLVPPLSAGDLEEAGKLARRKLPPRAAAELTGLVARVAALKDDLPGLASLSLRPVIASAGGVKVLDASAQMGEPAIRPDSRRAMMGSR